MCSFYPLIMCCEHAAIIKFLSFVKLLGTKMHSSRDVSEQGDVCLEGWCLSRRGEHHPSSIVNRITDRCKNITSTQPRLWALGMFLRAPTSVDPLKLRLQLHEIHAAAFDGHLFRTYFYRAGWGPWPLLPLDPLLRTEGKLCSQHFKEKNILST